MGRRPLLVAADPYRPAAADQLETLGKALDIPVYRAPTARPSSTSRRAVSRRPAAWPRRRDPRHGRPPEHRRGADGTRSASLAQAVAPAETLLVVDAMAGQEAVAVAEAFAAAVPLTGLILTKIDGDARGGAALCISAVTGLPVKFLGTGEKTDALEVFHPDRLAGRILGMGDVLTLVERAQEPSTTSRPRRCRRSSRRRASPSRTCSTPMQQIQKMGPLGQVVGMIPGFGGMAKEAQAAVDRGDLRRTEAIIRAMTPRERRDPTILNASRRRRIAARRRDRPSRGQQARQTVRRDAQDDEATQWSPAPRWRCGTPQPTLTTRGNPMTDQTEGGLQPQADPTSHPQAPAPVPAAEAPAAPAADTVRTRS